MDTIRKLYVKTNRFARAGLLACSSGLTLALLGLGVIDRLITK